METQIKSYFAPQLHIPSGCRDIDFYVKGFGAVELRRWSNEDGTIHVAELTIDGALFHLHEENHNRGHFLPSAINGITSVIGLFVENVDLVMANAINAGATLSSPAQDYDYGFRQGKIKDPFGHIWLIQKRIF